MPTVHYSSTIPEKVIPSNFARVPEEEEKSLDAQFLNFGHHSAILYGEAPWSRALILLKACQDYVN